MEGDPKVAFWAEQERKNLKALSTDGRLQGFLLSCSPAPREGARTVKAGLLSLSCCIVSAERFCGSPALGMPPIWEMTPLKGD